jgi:hypothetical protein
MSQSLLPAVADRLEREIAAVSRAVTSTDLDGGID